MRQDDRPYLEIRITLIHIVIMIVAVVLLGFLLTYLGYKAGKASAREPHEQPVAVQNFNPGAREMTVPMEQQPIEDVSEPGGQLMAQAGQPKDRPGASAIEEELRLHKIANDNKPTQRQTEPASKPISPKPIGDKEYFAIQVGAFSSFQNARSYAGHFNGMGYKTEIVSAEGAGGTLYRLWVGQYSDRNSAMAEKSKLEKKENKKFSLVSNR